MAADGSGRKDPARAHRPGGGAFPDPPAVDAPGGDPLPDPASSDAPQAVLLAPVAARVSTRAFDPDRPVEPAVLRRVLEAARWSPSSGNAQPWTYLVLDDEAPDARERARGLLRRGNAWARAAPVLLLATARTAFPPTPGKPARANPHAWHDVGAASLALALQATAEGLASPAMAGFDRDGAREAFGLPEGVDAVALIALGHPGDPAALPPDLAAREGARRRRPLDAVARRAHWDGPPLG